MRLQLLLVHKKRILFDQHNGSFPNQLHLENVADACVVIRLFAPSDDVPSSTTSPTNTLAMPDMAMMTFCDTVAPVMDCTNYTTQRKTTAQRETQQCAKCLPSLNDSDNSYKNLMQYFIIRTDSKFHEIIQINSVYSCSCDE